MRRGVLGGTFDPIHTGHLILAQEVQWRLGLDGIWFMPAGLPWMKKGEALTDREHRRAMVELAIESNPKFHLSTLELDRPGETYTVDTLEELRSGPMADGEILFIMGVDTLHSMHRWRNPARVLELALLVVALRPGHGKIDLTELLKIDPHAWERIMTLRMPLIEISGTELRRRVGVGEPVRYLVPDAVADYIAAHGLYRQTQPTRARG
ncbi:MAG: nicotinate-nucleotide adenylyltransferase [SAR202 cluster bacterium]|nr:nicotinate-nucleotide adenylyltransferase [SAR202 cluster bacterium]